MTHKCMEGACAEMHEGTAHDGTQAHALESGVCENSTNAPHFCRRMSGVSDATVFTGSRDGTIRAFDEVISTSEKEVFRCQVTSDQRKVAFARGDGSVVVFDTRSKELVKELKAHSKAVWGIAFTRNGSKMVTSSWYVVQACSRDSPTANHVLCLFQGWLCEDLECQLASNILDCRDEGAPGLRA